MLVYIVQTHYQTQFIHALCIYTVIQYCNVVNAH